MSQTDTTDGTAYELDIFQVRLGDLYPAHPHYEAARDAFAGMLAPADIGLVEFSTLYKHVGTDTVEADTFLHAATKAFPRWNNGSGQESAAFLAANEAEVARSLSAGDIVVVRADGYEKAYLCESIGWGEIERLTGATA